MGKERDIVFKALDGKRRRNNFLGGFRWPLFHLIFLHIGESRAKNVLGLSTC